MDELVDILDEHGNYTGEVLLKSEAHRKGLFHPTVHIWLYTRSGAILLQKRSLNKDTFPGKWDISVAGHIGAGEDIVVSAVREIEEEIGLVLAPKELQKIAIHKERFEHSPELTDCEFHHVFVAELKVPLEQLTLQETEVDEIRLVPVDVYFNSLKKPDASDFYVVPDPEYLHILETSLKNVLK